MGRKNVAAKKLSSAQSLAASFFSPVTDTTKMDNISYIVETSGITDNTGTFTLQARNKHSDNLNDQSQWIDLVSAAALANADTAFGIDADIKFSETRLKFVAAGGTPNGTCNIWFQGKVVGA